MSDLTTKFETLETQLATQHGEIMDALGALGTAIAAVDNTVVLANISTQLSELNDNLLLSNENNSVFYAALLGVLGQININTDTLINNNSLNTQRLLIAIAANDPCRDCGIVPIGPPPIQVTPQTIDQEHCQRMQALIYALLRFTVKLDALSSFGLGFSPTVIRDAITEIITELGVTGQLEYPSLGEVAQLAGAGAAYIVSNIFSSTSLPFEFQSISDELLTVLYDTDNASAGQSAYRSFLDGSGLDSTVIQLFKAMAYTSIFNLYYDSTNALDVSGYDGTICAPPEVVECDQYTSANRGDGYMIAHWGPTYTDTSHTTGNYNGYRFRLVSRSSADDLSVTYYNTAGTYSGVLLYFDAVGDSVVIEVNTAAVGIYSRWPNTGIEFVVEVCPPGSF